MNKINNKQDFKIDDLVYIKYMSGYSIGVVVDNKYKNLMRLNATILVKIIMSTHVPNIGLEFAYEPSLLRPFDDSVTIENLLDKNIFKNE